MSDDEKDTIDVEVQSFIQKCVDHNKKVQKLILGSDNDSMNLFI